MIPQNEPTSSRPPLTPMLAMMLALFGCSLHLLLLSGLMEITGPGTLAPFGIGAILGYGLAFALGVPLLSGDPATQLGFRAPRSRGWLAALLFVPAPLLASELNNVLNAYWPMPPRPEGAGLPQGVAVTLEAFAVWALVIPLVYEVFFRGLLQPRLARYWGSLGTVFGTALLAVVATPTFVIAVSKQLLTVSALPLLFMAPLLAGALRRSSGSVYPGALLCMALGAINLLAERELFGIPGFDRTEVTHTPIAYLVLPAAMVGVGLALCRGDASVLPEELAPQDPREGPPAG